MAQVILQTNKILWTNLPSLFQLISLWNFSFQGTINIACVLVENTTLLYVVFYCPVLSMLIQNYPGLALLFLTSTAVRRKRKGWEGEKLMDWTRWMAQVMLQTSRLWTNFPSLLPLISYDIVTAKSAFTIWKRIEPMEPQRT